MKNLEYFKQFMISEQSAENTINAYIIDVQKMLDLVGKEDCEITYLDLINWKNQIMDMASATVSRKIIAVRKYFEFLFDADFIEKNPAEKLHTIKIENEEKMALTQEQIRAMIKVAKGRDKAILLTLVSTAMRVSELIDLKLEDFYEDEITIIGKGNKARSIFLSPQTRKAIEDYLEIRKSGCENLFVSNTGKPMDRKCISAMLKKIARKAGLIEEAEWITPHTMRRTRITHWSENGVPLASIMYSAGHNNIKTTMRYIKKSDDCIKNTMMMEV